MDSDDTMVEEEVEEVEDEVDEVEEEVDEVEEEVDEVEEEEEEVEEVEEVEEDEIVYPAKTSKGARRGFPKSVHDTVWDQQHGKCLNPHCRKVLSRTTCENDHMDGVNSNNDVDNLWILCRECHCLKTNVQKQAGGSFSVNMLIGEDSWGNAHLRELKSILCADPELSPEQIQEKRALFTLAYVQMIQ